MIFAAILTGLAVAGILIARGAAHRPEPKRVRVERDRDPRLPRE